MEIKTDCLLHSICQQNIRNYIENVQNKQVAEQTLILFQRLVICLELINTVVQDRYRDRQNGYTKNCPRSTKAELQQFYISVLL